MALRLVPLLLLPVIIYVLFWFSWGENLSAHFAASLFAVPMISGEVWSVSLNTVFVLVAIVCLFVEIVRSATPTKWSLGENLVTAIAMSIGLVLFLTVRGFATSEFFIVIVLLLLDFITNSVVMAISARRTVEFQH